MLLYPNIKEQTWERVFSWIQFVTRARAEDVQAWNNLPNVFMAGRKVGKIPTGSADVADTDRLGDFNYTATYFYILVDDSGAAWRRIALGSW